MSNGDESAITVISGKTRDLSHSTACLQPAADEGRASTPWDFPRLLSQPPLASKCPESHVTFLCLILHNGFFLHRVVQSHLGCPDARCPDVSQLSNAPSPEPPPLLSCETAAHQFLLTPPSPDAGTELLFLVVLLHGIHDFIARHLSLPGRGVLA